MPTIYIDVFMVLNNYGWNGKIHVHSHRNQYFYQI